jgi:hypothetical protein
MTSVWSCARYPAGTSTVSRSTSKRANGVVLRLIGVRLERLGLEAVN